MSVSRMGVGVRVTHASSVVWCPHLLPQDSLQDTGVFTSVQMLPCRKQAVLVTFSIDVKRHRNQGNLQTKAFNWGLAHSFRRRVHDHHGGERAW